MTVSEQLRRSIKESGLTHYRIGTDTGISIRTVDRFISPGFPIKTTTLDVLCEFFGLELRKKTGTTAKKKTATPKRTAKKKR